MTDAESYGDVKSQQSFSVLDNGLRWRISLRMLSVWDVRLFEMRRICAV